MKGKKKGGENDAPTEHTLTKNMATGNAVGGGLPYIGLGSARRRRVGFLAFQVLFVSSYPSAQSGAIWGVPEDELYVLEAFKKITEGHCHSFKRGPACLKFI